MINIIHFFKHKIILSLTLTIFICNIFYESTEGSYCHAISDSKSNTNVFDHSWADTSSFKSNAQAITDSISTGKILYFAADGDDNNDGLSPSSPLKDPSKHLNNGNATILLKSGNIFTIQRTLSAGSNLVISTYGGNDRAVLNWVPVNSTPFSLYDAERNIYSAPIDSYTDRYCKVSWIKIEGYNTIDWQKVFSFSELNNNMDFYSDKEKKMIFLKSDVDISNLKFAFASNEGGINVNNVSNCSFNNLEIVGGGSGIYIKNNSSNIVIKNCYVHHSGGIENYSKKNGAYYRFGNGIQIWANGIKNVYIEGNYVSDIFDAGISPQISGETAKPSDSIFIYDNYVDRCLYNIEFYEHNRAKSTPLTNIYIQNNILTNAMDITNGYRYATYGYTSYFCSWSSNSSDTRFIVTNNIGYGTTDYAFAFYQATPAGVNNIEDNSLFVLNKSTVPDCIKNYEFYNGTDSQIVPIGNSTTYQKRIQNYISEYTAKFDKKNLFFEYLNNVL